MTNCSLALSNDKSCVESQYCCKWSSLLLQGAVHTQHNIISPSWDFNKTKVLDVLIANNPQTSSPALPQEYLACLFSCIAPGNRCVCTMLYHRQLWYRAGQEEILNCFTPAHEVGNCILKVGFVVQQDWARLGLGGRWAVWAGQSPALLGNQ